ncbi:MAG TPA: hypothetical protein VGS27_27085 [Candidatus Sulfotelmatobacter sp.]|nr:hypothetical protein [Candidatus Sulfotelmatobacter sp.]
MFTPKLQILPAAQRKLWEELGHTPKHFVLYGGTALIKKFGAPVEHDGVTAVTFTEKQVVCQLGIAPIRIDILTEITGVEFANA